MHRVTGYINYVTREGDTFDALALSVYNDEKKSHLIIQFNPDYADVVVFEAFVNLRIPVVEENTKSETLAPWRRE